MGFLNQLSFPGVLVKFGMELEMILAGLIQIFERVPTVNYRL